VRYAVPRKQLETMGVRSRKSHGRGASKLYLIDEYAVAVRLGKCLALVQSKAPMKVFRSCIRSRNARRQTTRYLSPWLLIDRIFVVNPHKMSGTGPETRRVEIVTIGTWTFKALPYN
jgi:hypothetical protein